MRTHLVSIIIPCYNQAAFLEDTLACVNAQTHTNWECLLIDDGSTDATALIAKKWCEKDPRFQYYSKPNTGVSETRNIGLQKASGTYIQFLDADDSIAPIKLAISIAQFEQKPAIDIVYTNFEMFEETISRTSPPYCTLSSELFTFENILYTWNDGFSIPIHCGLFKKQLFEGVKFPKHLTAQEDWMVWVSLFKNGAKAHFIDTSLAFYRQNPNSRMASGDMVADQMGAVEHLKSVITPAEYEILTKILIHRYFLKSTKLIQELESMRTTAWVRIGIKIRRGLKRIGLLKGLKKYLP